MPFTAGDIVAGRFEIVRRLGAGGLAEVLLARDAVTGYEVALKVLHLHLAEDPALATRFRREMSITRAPPSTFCTCPSRSATRWRRPPARLLRSRLPLPTQGARPRTQDPRARSPPPPPPPPPPMTSR